MHCRSLVWKARLKIILFNTFIWITWSLHFWHSIMLTWHRQMVLFEGNCKFNKTTVLRVSVFAVYDTLMLKLHLTKQNTIVCFAVCGSFTFWHIFALQSVWKAQYYKRIRINETYFTHNIFVDEQIDGVCFCC